MFKKGLWALFIFLALAVALLATIPFFIEDKFGVTQTKTDELLANKVWRFGLYTHIISGGISLLIGWSSFIKKLRNKYLSIHRNIGLIDFNKGFYNNSLKLADINYYEKSYLVIYRNFIFSVGGNRSTDQQTILQPQLEQTLSGF